MAYETSEAGRQGLPDVTAKELVEIIKNRFKNKKVRPTPILIMGKSGVGKTESVYQVVQELGIGLKEVVLTEYESTDLAGLPKIMDRQDIDETVVLNNQSDLYTVEHIRPRLLPDPVKEKHCIKKYCEATGKKPEDIDIMDLPVEARKYVAGILFFDEVPAACRENRVAAAKLLDKSRRIGDYVLPDRWLVICAGNGPEDGGVYDDLEGFFFNRCQGFRFEPDVDNWIEWAVKHNIMPEIIAFIKTYPELIWDGGANDENGGYTAAFPSPRAWANASIELQNFLDCKPEGYKLTERDIYINVAGIVGTTAASKFTSFYAYNNDIIPVSDIENGTARINIGDNSRDAAYLQASIVANHLNKRAEEYNKATGNKDFTKLKNILNWVGQFANNNLDAGLELIREALHGGSSQTYILVMANYELINRLCPDFIMYYKEHSQVYQYN
jgi:hypothetical protein